jgi:hypothetical protein
VDHGGGRGGIGRLTLIPFNIKDPWFVSFVPFLFLLSAPKAASAQIYESIGIRAQGMSGAFVAVADDATTTWWNPAGLASGGYFNGIIEFDRVDHPAGTRARAFALNVPSLGFSYYRLALNGMRLTDPTGASSASRKDEGVLNQFGATVGQSVGPHLILGSTLKLVHALGKTGGDLDMGAMATFSRFRLGLAVKNLRAPEFSDGDTRLELTRQVRAGASVRGGSPSRAEILGAVDMDLTTTPTAVGEERHLATGVEAWLVNRAVGLRAGVGMNTIGESRTSGSVGVSVGLRGGSFLDGQLTRGADEARNGWGLALRVTF